MSKFFLFFIIVMTHKSEDYKISAVKYYLKNKDNIRKTCKTSRENGDKSKNDLNDYLKSIKSEKEKKAFINI